MEPSSLSPRPVGLNDRVTRIREKFSENPIDLKVLRDLRRELAEAIAVEESSDPFSLNKASKLLRKIDKAVLIVQGNSDKIRSAVEEGELDLNSITWTESLCLERAHSVKELFRIKKIMTSALEASETYHRSRPIRDGWNRLRHPSLRPSKGAVELTSRVKMDIEKEEERLRAKAEKLRRRVGKTSCPIRVPPLVPAKGNPIDRAKAAEWVSMHPPESQGAAQAIIDNTHHVSFDEFHERLREVVTHINIQIPDGEQYVILVQDEKSNKWLAELSLPFLRSLPHDIRRLPHDHRKELEELGEYLKENGVKHVVLLDDACYSGDQMSGHVRNVGKACLIAGGEGYQVHVGVLFMTQWGEGALQDAAKDFEVTTLDIAPHQTMKSIREQIPPEHHAMINRMYFRDTPAIARSGLIKLANLKVSKNLSSRGQYEVWYKELKERMEDPDEFSALMNLLSEIGKVKKHWLSYSPEKFYEWLVEYPKMDQWEKMIRDLSKDKEFEEKLPKGRANRANMVKRKIKRVERLHKHERGMESRTLTYFDHTVSDSVSTLGIFRGGGWVYDEEGKIQGEVPFVSYERDCEVYKPGGEKRGKEDLFAYFGITTASLHK